MKTIIARASLLFSVLFLIFIGVWSLYKAALDVLSALKAIPSWSISPTTRSASKSRDLALFVCTPVLGTVYIYIS